MRIIKFCLLFMFYSVGIFAQNAWFSGKTMHLPLPAYLKKSTMMFHPALNFISLMEVNLSTEQYRKVLWSLTHAKVQKKLSDLPTTVDLGMNGVPVLNQGVHGTCVTFAVTAALDAAIQKGDYVSQLCNLQLGSYLENNGYVPSGWNGSVGEVVLNQLKSFGLMSKESQQQYGCGDLNEYPLIQDEHGRAMALDEFHQHSESLGKYDISWATILGLAHGSALDTDDQVLYAVKDAISHGDRVVFGTLLVDVDKGLSGAVATHKVFNDTWVVTPELIQDMRLNPIVAGHAMVVVGYDDDAIAKDDHDRVHQGLLKLRNSWGDRIGDQGDFYMSYDYFKALAVEIQRIYS